MMTKWTAPPATDSQNGRSIRGWRLPWLGGGAVLTVPTWRINVEDQESQPTEEPLHHYWGILNGEVQILTREPDAAHPAN